MLNVTAKYAAENAKLARTPVYRATFAVRRGSPLTTTEYKFSTHPIVNYIEEVLADSPSLLLRFNEATGTVADDESGNGLDGTYFNGPTLGVDGPLTGSAQTAVEFVGASSQYVTVPDNALLDPGDTFTLEFWIKPTAFAPDGGGGYLDEYILSKGANGYAVRISSVQAGVITLSKQDVADIGDSLGLGLYLALGSWQHVVVTKTGATHKIYINGVECSSDYGNQTIAGTATALNVARNSGASDYLYDSVLSNVAIYPTALSAERVLAHYNSGRMAQHLADVYDDMDLPDGQESSIESAQEIIGSLRLAIQDIDGRMTAIVGAIGASVVTFQGGFDNIQAEEFADLPGGIVENYKMNANLDGYDISVRDPDSLANKQIFNVSSTQLTEALAANVIDTYTHWVEWTFGRIITSNDQDAAAYTVTLDAELGAGNWSFYQASAATVATTATVESTTFFRSSGHLQIGDEIISYSGKTATTFTGLVRAVENSGYPAGYPLVHQEGAQVKEALVIGPDLPMTIAKNTLTNTDKTGCGIDPDFVDSDQFDDVQAILGTVEMKFIVTDQANARDWLLQEIYRATGTTSVTRNGKLSVNLIAQPLAGDSVATLDDDSCFAHGWDGNFSSLANHWFVYYDWNPILGKFQSTYEATDDDSIARFGDAHSEIQAKGFRTDISGTVDFIASRVTALLNRYSNTAPLIPLSAHLQKDLIQVGDLIELTSANLPDIFSGLRGITRGLFEVIKARPGYSAGYVTFGLLYTPFSAPTEDDFNRADTDWDTQPGLGLPLEWNSNSACLEGIEINSNHLRLGKFGAGGGGYGFAWRINERGSSQASEVEFSSASSGAGGPAVRQNNGGGYLSYTGYVAAYDKSNNRIELRYYSVTLLDGATFTLLDGPYAVTLAATDRLRIQCDGVNIWVLLNGTEILRAVDTNISEGYPGIMMDKATGSLTWNSWRGGLALP